MEANTRQMERIFDRVIQYQVPLFQRPYVWNKDEHWNYLWDDIKIILDRHLLGHKVNPHFLGAVVLEQTAHDTGGIETRQVIDGQQRFTTLQLFLLAARNIANAYGVEKYIDRIGDLVANRRSKIDSDEEAFKVWPTNSDRASFRLVHRNDDHGAMLGRLESASSAVRESNITGAYLYFHERLTEWMAGSLDEDGDVSGKTGDDRLEALWKTIKDSLQLVVIDLGPGDETQVIFETMNARGQELLPADLIKNFLFRRATAEKDDVEKLYELYWAAFEDDFWRKSMKQGRLERARLDIFVNHYLTLMLRDEVRSSHLFNAFRSYVLDDEGGTPHSAAAHIARISAYGAVFRRFFEGPVHPRLRTFIERMTVLDTSTIIPFVMHAYAELMPKNQAEFDGILDVVESFLVRRMVCNLTTKNYNRLFVDLIKALDRDGAVSAKGVRDHLSKGTGESVRFPDDGEFHEAAVLRPLYGRIAQFKIRLVLEALDGAAQTTKGEVLPLPQRLTIEHVMPQAWQEHWPLPETKTTAERLSAVMKREDLVNALGNLTLVTGSLNPALSNGPWKQKRPELLKHSKLNLTRYFHESHADEWSESAIRARGEALFQCLTAVWPSR